MPETITTTAEGGLQYQLLCNDDHQFFDYLHYSKFDVDSITGDGFTTHYMVIRCEEIRTKCLPNTANPRDPRAGGVVTEMQRTLFQEPEKFYQFNGGITIACSGVELIPDVDQVRIDFGTKDGICNGGHTYFSIQTMDQINPSAVLLLEVLELPENMDEVDKRKIIGEIARKRNKNRQLNTGTQLNHLGHFDIFKERMKTERIYAENLEVPEIEENQDTAWEDFIRDIPEIYWYEGDNRAYPELVEANMNGEEPDRMKSSHFIRLLASMDPCLYRHWVCNIGGNGTHQNTATGDGSQTAFAKAINEAIEDPSKEVRKMRHMAPLAYDILKFRDYISHDLAYGDYPLGYRGSGLFSWLSNGKSQQEGYPLRRFTFNTDEDNGMAAPVTAYPLICGLFRNNVWLGRESGGGTFQYSGWYELPWETYNFELNGQILRHRQMGDLKESYSVHNEPVNFKKMPSIYSKSWIDDKYGMGGIPPFPVEFYDVENYRHKYTQVEQPEDATHAMFYPAGKAEMYVSIVEKDDPELELLDDGDFKYYNRDERIDLIPETMHSLQWQMKNNI